MKKSEPTRWLRRSAAFIIVALLLIVGAACTGSGYLENELKALDELDLNLGDLVTIGQIGPDGLTPEQLALLEKLEFESEQIDTMDQLLGIGGQILGGSQSPTEIGSFEEELDNLDSLVSGLTLDELQLLEDLVITNPTPEQQAILDGLGLAPNQVFVLAEILKSMQPVPPGPPEDLGFVQNVGDDAILGNGFDDRQNSFPWSMQWWKGHLYVGTGRSFYCVAAATRDKAIPGSEFYKESWADVECAVTPQDLPLRGEIWRYNPQTKVWQRVFQSPQDIPIPDGKLAPRDIGFRSMAVFTESDGTEALYVAGVSSRSINGDELPPPRILRSVDGVNFEPIPQDNGTFLAELPVVVDDPSLLLGRGFRSIIVYKDRLYVTVSDFHGVGVLIESADPAAGNDSFRQVSLPSMKVWGLQVFNDSLYLGLENESGYVVVRTDASGDPPYNFTAIVTNGGYKPGHRSIGALSMYPFKGSLYVGTDRPTELIRINADDSWDLIIGDPRMVPFQGLKTPLSGLGQYAGNYFNGHFWRMQAHDGKLYLTTWDWSIELRFFDQLHELTKQENGFDMLVTEDGEHWQFVTKSGFGDGFNYGGRTMASTPYGLFVGAANPFYGLEIWQSGDKADIAITDWTTPETIDGLVVSEQRSFTTEKTLHNFGPFGPVDVDVRKSMDVPPGTEGSVHVTQPAGERITVPSGVPYRIIFPDSSVIPGVGPLDELLPVGTTVVAAGSPGVIEPELGAHFEVGDLPVSQDVSITEEFDVHCLVPGLFTYMLTNQVSPQDATGLVIDSNQANNAMTVPLEVDCTPRSLLLTSYDRLVALRDGLAAGTLDPGSENSVEDILEDLDKAAEFVNSSLHGLRPGDSFHLIPKLGKDFFFNHRQAVKSIFSAIDDGLVNPDVLSELQNLVVGGILSVEEAIVRTAIDDAVAAGGHPQQVQMAQEALAEGVGFVSQGLAAGIAQQDFFDDAVDAFDTAWSKAQQSLEK